MRKVFITKAMALCGFIEMSWPWWLKACMAACREQTLGVILESFALDASV